MPGGILVETSAPGTAEGTDGLMTAEADTGPTPGEGGIGPGGGTGKGNPGAEDTDFATTVREKAPQESLAVLVDRALRARRTQDELGTLETHLPSRGGATHPGGRS